MGGLVLASENGHPRVMPEPIDLPPVVPRHSVGDKRDIHAVSNTIPGSIFIGLPNQISTTNPEAL
jgi:hypothetical protein